MEFKKKYIHCPFIWFNKVFILEFQVFRKDCVISNNCPRTIKRGLNETFLILSTKTDVITDGYRGYLLL